MVSLARVQETPHTKHQACLSLAMGRAAGRDPPQWRPSAESRVRSAPQRYYNGSCPRHSGLNSGPSCGARDQSLVLPACIALHFWEVLLS
jgi:hypothetical protein